MGAATASLFGAHGAAVAVCDRQPGGPVAEVPTGPVDGPSGSAVLSRLLDVRDTDSMDGFVADAVSAFGRLDFLIHNAGGTFASPFADVSAKGEAALIAENFTHITHLTRVALAHLQEGAAIVTITSIEAHRAAPGFAVYTAMKAGLANLTATLALEAPRQRGIRVNAVAPDAISSGGEQVVGDGSRPPASRTTPLGSRRSAATGTPRTRRGRCCSCARTSPASSPESRSSSTGGTRRPEAGTAPTAEPDPARARRARLGPAPARGRGRGGQLMDQRSDPDTGRNYVVVSADAHAAPDTLDAVPLLRRSGPPRGGGGLRRPLVGGHPHVRGGRPRRGRRRRRRAGRGHPAAGRHGRRHRRRRRRGWPATARSGCSPPTPTAGGSPTSRSRASTPRWCSPGPVLAGGLSPAMYLGRPHDEEPRRRCGRPCGPTTGGWPSSWPPPRAGGPGASPSTSTTWTGPTEAIAWARDHGIHGGVMLPAMSLRTGLPGYADEYYEPLWSACEEHGIVVNLHTGASGSATDAKQLYDDRARRVPRPLRGVRVHPPAPVVHDLRRRLRPPSRPQGGGHRERGAVAALAGAGHGVLLRHPRRGAGALLPRDAPVGVRRPPRVPGRVAHAALRGRDARGDRGGPAHVGRRLPPPRGGRPRPPPGPAPGLRGPARGGPPPDPRAATPVGSSASTRRSSRRWPTGSGPPWPTCPRRSTMDEIPETFSWSLARPVPVRAKGA